jgi:general secretion pathway protein D
MQGAIKSDSMLRMSLILSAAFVMSTLALPASARSNNSSPDLPASGLPISCANGLIGGVNCVPTKEDLKDARKAYERGVRLNDQQHFEEALTQFRDAARLAPQNMKFLTAREVVKARLVFDHIERGNVLLMAQSRAQAAAEFRAALDLDSSNHFAFERLQEATRDPLPKSPSPPSVSSLPLYDSEEIRLDPPKDLATFHYSGDARGLFTELAAAYKMTVQFDESVKQRQVTFNVDNLDLYTALKLACETAKTMWTPLDAHQFLIAEDTAENHKQFDRMSLRTFILPPHTQPTEAKEVIDTMRLMFGLKYISPGLTGDLVEVRAPSQTIEACGKLIEQLTNERPQIMLDVRVFQISHQLTRNIGVHIPNTFTMYNIPAAALAGLAGLSGQNIQQLINQLVSSGGINQAGNSSLSGLLSQLTGQQNSIFSTPLATFGGGLTFMGLSLDEFVGNLSVNESWVRSLENLSMRANQGTEAIFHLGERYPVINASYAPIYNSSQISQVLGNQTSVPPIPSVSYEDLGLQVKTKPIVHGDDTVSMDIELQVRSLTGQSNNGVPIISNREYKGSVNLKDGEPTFIAGEISQTDTLSMSGIPGLGFVPLLNMAMVNNTKEEDDDELMIAITPHVVSNFSRDGAQAIWLSEK